MKSDQDLYKRLRDLPKEQLWQTEVSRFNAASPRERMEGVAVIRAVGMIFSRFGTVEEKATVRDWLTQLLSDPQEKIRRYAMAALPKVGAGEGTEEQMLALLKQTGEERERRHLGRALEKVGGSATLAVVRDGTMLPSLTEQKVKAALIRRENPGSVRMEALLPADEQEIHLRCRRGLEGFVRDEAEEKLSQDIFKIGAVRPGCVTVTAQKPFSLAMLYQIRSFATIGFSLGLIRNGDKGSEWIGDLAHCISSRHARALLTAATEGVVRYRLDFPARGHQRGAIRQVVERAYARAPEILNDSRQALWSVDVIPLGVLGKEASVELRPRLYPDPRLAYRQDDIAAASHPPLAACMVRLAGKFAEPEVIWDPFCGSGLELIERAMQGGVAVAYGTDLDVKALEVAQANFEAANLHGTRLELAECDFRDAGLDPGSVTLVISNPPLGRRVRVKNIRGLFADFYAAASRVLKPGGRLIFANPLRTGPNDPSLKLEFSKTVDLGGFNCQLEMYRKVRR
jgi:SAM-dependent methyltransferase